ncbi:hypothetical protein [Desulfosporosinus sp. I2]|uniref:hypothetical protein n=1 Tax=Desulfosporosinus sp. I2 TaxID=1617025 RepID=UPI0005EF975E|nr:hypothetical protein [Desulfosporosinus sp. I2]
MKVLVTGAQGQLDTDWCSVLNVITDKRALPILSPIEPIHSVAMAIRNALEKSLYSLSSKYFIVRSAYSVREHGEIRRSGLNGLRPSQEGIKDFLAN